MQRCLHEKLLKVTEAEISPHFPHTLVFLSVHFLIKLEIMMMSLCMLSQCFCESHTQCFMAFLSALLCVISLILLFRSLSFSVCFFSFCLISNTNACLGKHHHCLSAQLHKCKCFEQINTFFQEKL